MVELGPFALSLVVGLINKAISSGVSYTGVSYFTRRKVERRVEDTTAEVIEPLLPFLAQEHVSEDKQRRLIQTCVEELQPLTAQPELLFQGSLNGQKIFEDIYAERDLPQVIIEDGLKDIYSLVFPRIATLLGRIPAVVKDWEGQAWSENFRRFDELTAQMRSLFTKVDSLVTTSARQADETLATVRRALAQKVGFELDLTGLRGDSPVAVKFADLFIHPQIAEDALPSRAGRIVLDSASGNFSTFTAANHKAILTGAPGAGKSTWSKWLLSEALSTRWTGIAVRVELRGLSGNRLPSLHDLVREVAGKHFAEDLTAERIGIWLAQKQILFILDGFDEIRPPDRDSILEWIKDLVEAARDCPCVVTSRPLTTDHIERFKKSWKRWTIQPFDESRIIDYISRWYRFTPLLLDSDRGLNTSVLAAGWLEDPTLNPLTGNPLLLSTLLMVHHLDGSLPSGRSQLYKRYVEGMLGLWDDRRKVTTTSIPFSLQQKMQVLRGLAILLFNSERDQIDESEVLMWLETSLRSMNVSIAADDVLATLRERSGLIVGPGVYSFSHKSIAEYLVAETILQGDQIDDNGRRMDRFLLFEFRDDDRWNTVTFLWSGLAPIADVESFIDECTSVNAVALACGLLDDQFDRIPLQIRRRLVSQLLLKGNELPLQYGPHWVASHPTDERGWNLDIPTFEPRQLTEDAEFSELIEKLVDTNTIVWSDLEKVKGSIRDLIWMSFATNCQDLEVWQACLRSQTPVRGVAEAWFLWSLEGVFYQTASPGAPTTAENVMKTFRGCRREFENLLPIALIDVIISLLTSSRRQGYPNEQNDESRRKAIRALLLLVPLLDRTDDTAGVLSHTRDWTIGHGRTFDDRVGDLIAFFIKEIEQSPEDVIPRDELYETVLSFVERLKLQREHRSQ